MQVAGERIDHGVVERRFDMTIDGERVPGIIWAPEHATGPTPVVLIGHGGAEHKRVASVISLARGLVREAGYTAVAIDAPGHGDRVNDPASAGELQALRRRIASALRTGSAVNGNPDDAERWAAARARAVREWTVTIDTLDAQGLVAGGRVGYLGFSMGAAIGLLLIASEPRIQVAVLGLAGVPQAAGALEEAARRTTIPILFVMQWDDELISRDDYLRLFDAIGSRDKMMHVHPGGHRNVPLYERGTHIAFLERHLGH
jgi:dienelactone hydrolase